MSERVLEPLEMSDTEILDWMNEYCVAAHYLGGGSKRFEVDNGSFIRHGKSLRDAVCNAAARQKELDGV